MRDGVIIDCGRQEGGAHPKEDDDWWLDLYVMLSRATRLDDLLLIRAPDLSFFAKGPPKTLRSQLAKFASRTDACRKQAEKTAKKIGIRLLHSSRIRKTLPKECPAEAVLTNDDFVT